MADNAKMDNENNLVSRTVQNGNQQPAAARAAALNEAADFYDQLLKDMAADVGCDPRYWTAIRDVAKGLRHRADEQPPIIEARPAETDFVIERHDGNQWLPIGYPRPTLDEAMQVRDGRRVKAPADKFRIVEWTTAARVVETDEVPACAEAVQA